MAQVNISHFSDISENESKGFTLGVQQSVGKIVHGLEKSELESNTISLFVIPVDQSASISGADTEVQVLISGNDWPKQESGQPFSSAEAKIHFDKIAEAIYESISKQTQRVVYVWVTPFMASGWAEAK